MPAPKELRCTTFWKIFRAGAIATAVLTVFGLAGCGGHDNNDNSTPDAQQLAASCTRTCFEERIITVPCKRHERAEQPWSFLRPQAPRNNARSTARSTAARVPTVTAHANPFRLRLPITGWNGRFYMGGGGGTDGTLVDPQDVAVLGYATIGTDSGHDNTINNVTNAGGIASLRRSTGASSLCL